MQPFYFEYNGGKDGPSFTELWYRDNVRKSSHLYEQERQEPCGYGRRYPRDTLSDAFCDRALPKSILSTNLTCKVSDDRIVTLSKRLNFNIPFARFTI